MYIDLNRVKGVKQYNKMYLFGLGDAFLSTS